MIHESTCWFLKKKHLLFFHLSLSFSLSLSHSLSFVYLFTVSTHSWCEMTWTNRPPWLSPARITLSICLANDVTFFNATQEWNLLSQRVNQRHSNWVIEVAEALKVAAKYYEFSASVVVSSQKFCFEWQQRWHRNLIYELISPFNVERKSFKQLFKSSRISKPVRR